MKIKALLIAAAAMVFSTAANADFIVDLSGEVVDSTTNVITVNNDNSNAVTGISFDFTYFADDAAGAWGSDFLLQIVHVPTNAFAQIGTQAGSCDAFFTLCNFDLMWDTVGGVFEGAGDLAFDLADGSGDYEILLASSFDAFGGPEGMMQDGSSITLIQEAAAVPAPATLLLVGIGLLGLGAARRRA